MEIEIFNNYEIKQEVSYHTYLAIDELKEYLEECKYPDEESIKNEIIEFITWEMYDSCFEDINQNIVDDSKNIEIANLTELIEHFKYLINDGEN